MRTFGELNPGDNLYRINRNKVKIIKILSVSSDDTFTYMVTNENRYNNPIFRKDTYVNWKTFSCKEALIAYISKEINKLENKCNKLEKLLAILK